jgi:hypothetical protein
VGDFTAVGDFTVGSEVSAAVDSIVLPAVFMVDDSSAVGVALGEGSDIMDFMVIPFTGTTAAPTITTGAIIRRGLRSTKCDSSFENHGREPPSVMYLAITRPGAVKVALWYLWSQLDAP